MSDPAAPAKLPVVPTRGRLRPLGLDELSITAGFWAQRQAVNARATLDHCLTTMERLGWTGNFRTTAANDSGPRPGREFSDSEVYKLAEAMAWEIGRSGDAGLSAALNKLAVDIGGAQHTDGYLNTAFGGPSQPARYSDLEWGHELYCAGHLIQAAVAQTRSTGGGDLLPIATALADHIGLAFGPAGLPGLCGHPEIETALVELARLTGQERYLDQASRFIARRGKGMLGDISVGREYFQDDIPVRDATVLRGHAVRALYLAAGAVDVAVETGDDALLDAIITQWENTVAKRTYLTGGMGSRHSGESFGDDFELAPDRAYAETCAGVASIMLSWRLLLATGDPRYGDLIERTLFNIVATSSAEDGRSFFYVNTLHRRTRAADTPSGEPNPRPVSGVRASWFEVSCCPTNIARLLASLSAYVATVDEHGVQIHQYAEGSVRTTVGGTPVELTIRTRYPEHGEISIEVDAAPAYPITLSLRIPQWAAGGAHVTAPGELARQVWPGSAAITRSFRPREVITLTLPVTPRWTMADSRIDAVRGQLAVERGPVVMCVESLDLPGDTGVDAVRVDPSLSPTDDRGHVVVAGSLATTSDTAWPYANFGAGPALSRQDSLIPLVPYHRWANRGPSTMRVWLPAQD